MDFDNSSSSRILSTGDPSKGSLTANRPVPTARRSPQPRSSSVVHTPRTIKEQMISSETPQATSHALLNHRLANDESDQQHNWYKESRIFPDDSSQTQDSDLQESALHSELSIDDVTVNAATNVQKQMSPDLRTSREVVVDRPFNRPLPSSAGFQ